MSYLEEEARKDYPNWDEGGRVHNWRNHVGHYTRDIWPELTPRHRLAIARDADQRAMDEEWE